MVLDHFSREDIDMASDSPARSLDEIDLSALRVSRTRFLISFQWFGSGLMGSGGKLGPASVGRGECDVEGTWLLVLIRGLLRCSWLSLHAGAVRYVSSLGCGQGSPENQWS